jgi:WD40 repeat protein/tRNA A-37 threonylcarbamoyl transferase component Bud32
MSSVPASVQSDDPERDERLHEIIAAYLEAIEAGIPIDREALLAREPALAAELSTFFANEDHLAKVAVAYHQPPTILPYPAVQGDDPSSAHDLAEDMPGSHPKRLRYFGDYELLDVIAEGGMGIVYRARQVSLNRILALKMIRDGRFAKGEDLARFRFESRAAAQLDHPHIVPIYEVGEHEGHHYFSMKLIVGGHLASESKRFHALPHVSARLIATVARAVHYAHLRGILHRDLKPANILLSGSRDDSPDRLVPMIADFGLAKRFDAGDSSGPTSSGSIVGTPAYMAPEQAEGRRESVTTAVDIHALGAMLYELVTGRPPFHGDSVMETLRQVREQEPVRPRSLDRQVPRDLETIIMKCLEKRPSQRYHSAGALADDLDRWLADLPILARRATPLEHVVKLVRRRRAAAALVALAAALAFVSIVALWNLVSTSRLQGDIARAGLALDTEKQQRVNAETQLVGMEDETYFKQLLAADEAWEGNDPERADLLLDRCPERLRGWEWHHLRRKFHSELQTLKGHNGYLCAVSFTPEGTEVACAAEPRGFMLWETASGQVVRRIPGHDGTALGLAFDRIGTRMASAASTGEVRVWELKTGEAIALFRGHRGWVAGVAFSPDGKTLASAGEDGTIRIWSLDHPSDGRDPSPEVILRGHAGAVFGVAFSPDGSLLASAGQDGTVRVWNLGPAEGERCRVFRGHRDAVRCVAFHPLQNVLASAGADRLVRLWDGATGREIRHFGEFGNRVDGIAFSPEGNRIATASLDRSVRVWDTQTGQPVRSFPGHAAPVFSVTFSPDGNKLASASQDATVKVWDLTAEPGVRLLSLSGRDERRETSQVGWVGGLAFRPDGAELAAAGTDQTLAAWNLETGKARIVTTPAWGMLTTVRYSPDGRMLATGSADRRIRIRDASSLRETAVLEDISGGLVSLAFHPTKPILATGGGDPLEVLHMPRGKETPVGRGPRSVRLWDLKTGSPLRSFTDHLGSIHALLFHADGTRLISAGADGVIIDWDASTGGWLEKLVGHSSALHALALAPDGRHLASAGVDNAIVIWDLREGRSIRSLVGHTNWILDMAFNRDGSRLASASADRTVRLWDPETGRPILTLRGHHDRVHGVAFSPDGKRLASASGDGEVRIWETDHRDEHPASQDKGP